MEGAALPPEQMGLLPGCMCAGTLQLRPASKLLGRWALKGFRFGWGLVVTGLWCTCGR